MMSDIFIKLLNISITAGYAILAVIALVDFNEAALATAPKKAKKTTRRSSKKAVEAAPAVETPAAEVETPAAE